LATGRFDESGRVQLVSAWQSPHPQTRTEIWRGDGRSLTSGASGANNLGRIDARNDWIADALAAGNFDGEGPDELVIAMHHAANTRSAIFYGDATDSRGSRIFESEGEWRVLAMASGNFDRAAKDSLVTAFLQQRDANGAGTLRVYQGDGVESAQNDLLFEAQGAMADALAVSTTDSGTPYLYAAFNGIQGGPSAIRYSAGANLGAFGDITDSAQSSGRVTHLAAGRNGRAVSAAQGQTENIVSDADGIYHRWNQPNRTIRCSAR
jgi:hypothetical protein